MLGWSDIDKLSVIFGNLLVKKSSYVHGMLRVWALIPSMPFSCYAFFRLVMNAPLFSAIPILISHLEHGHSTLVQLLGAWELVKLPIVWAVDEYLSNKSTKLPKTASPSSTVKKSLMRITLSNVHEEVFFTDYSKMVCPSDSRKADKAQGFSTRWEYQLPFGIYILQQPVLLQICWGRMAV